MGQLASGLVGYIKVYEKTKHRFVLGAFEFWVLTKYPRNKTFANNSYFKKSVCNLLVMLTVSTSTYMDKTFKHNILCRKSFLEVNDFPFEFG